MAGQPAPGTPIFQLRRTAPRAAKAYLSRPLLIEIPPTASSPIRVGYWAVFCASAAPAPQLPAARRVISAFDYVRRQ